MNTVRAMKSPRASIPLSPNTIRQTKGSRVRSPVGSKRTGGDCDGKVSGRPRSNRLERANEPRVHASNRSDSWVRPTITRLGLEMGAYLSADKALKLLDLA